VKSSLPAIARTPTTGHYRFIAFIIAGGIAALVNIASRIVFNLIMPYEIAILVAYACGMTTAYLLNKCFVFAVSGRSVASEYTRFTLVNLLAVGQVWLVSVGLALLFFPAIGFTWHKETIAHVIGVLAPVFTSYLGHKHLSFARQTD
jgi:putative flippase GtrA